MKLNQHYEWLDDKGTPLSTNSNTCVDVALPRDYSAITRAFLAQTDESLNQPAILPRWNDGAAPGLAEVTLREGDDETLLIRGRELWRNPEVYLGGQLASAVSVLPDMAGLRAEFRSIRLPAAEKREPQFLDLTVVTSAGSTVLREGVRILPRAGRADPAKFAQLQNNFVVLNSNLVFTVDAALLPQSFEELVLSVSDGNQERLAPISLPGANSPRAPQWEVPFSANYLSKVSTNGSQEIFVDLGLRPRPDPKDRLVPILADAPRSLVVFTNVLESQYKLSTATITIPPSEGALATIKLELATSPDLFAKARSGLKDAIASGNAEIGFFRNGTNAFKLALKKSEGKTFEKLELALDVSTAPSVLPPKSTNEFTLKVMGDQLEVPVSSKLTIKRSE